MSSPLAATIGAVREKLRLNGDGAHATFHSASRLGAGLRSDVRLRQHALVVDEPPQLGGNDAGPNPVELVLAALGACQEITYRAYASALGIPLDGVAVRLEGDLDLRGFLGLDAAARPGFSRIRGTVELTSSAPLAELERLRAAVDAHCPVLDMLRTPVPVELALARCAP